MELLHELVFAVKKRPSTLFSFFVQESSKLHQLFQLISEDEFLTDEQAARYLYGSVASDKRYLMLKRNLTSKISELVLLSNPGEHAETSVKFALEKKLSIAEKLLYQNVYHNPIKTARKVLKEADRYQFTDLKVRVFRLMIHCSTLKGDLKELKSAQKNYHLTCRYFWQEEKAWEAMQLFEAKIKYSSALKGKSVTELMDMLKSRAKKAPESLNIRFLWQKASVYRDYHFQDYASLLNSTAALEAFLSEYSQFATNKNQLFTLTYQIRAALGMGRYEGLEDAFERANQLSSYCSFDRFDVARLQFVFLLRKQQLTRAISLITEITNTPQFQRLHQMDQSAWKISSYYVLLARDNVTFGAGESQISSTALHKLTKDKQGYSVHFYIINALLLIKENNLTRLYDEANKLNSYYQRHLRNGREERLKIFLKYLIKRMKKAGKPAKINRLKEKTLKRLGQFTCYDANEYFSFDHLVEKDFTLTSDL